MHAGLSARINEPIWAIPPGRRGRRENARHYAIQSASADKSVRHYRRVAEHEASANGGPGVRSLLEHHVTLPAMPPVRSPEEAWELRKRQYLDG